MRTLLVLLPLLLVTACGGGDTRSNVPAPGADESAKTQALETGAAVLQDKPPLEAVSAYLDGFHFYNGRMQSQMEAHHYCAVLNDDVIQCLIYDGNVKNARLMGVEYIVSAKLFGGLPEAEKALWHSHAYEVKSGSLVAPGLPDAAEHELMEKIVSTYGKTWHTWHTDLNKDLPYGVPQLMMGFTADGQSDPKMIADRDSRMGIDTQAKKQSRADIPAPSVDPAADGWQKGNTYQVPDPTGSQHGHEERTSKALQTQDKNENARSTRP
jgi:hypothetical protein